MTFPRSKSERCHPRLSPHRIDLVRQTWSNVLWRSTVIIPIQWSNVRRNIISNPTSWVRNEIQRWRSIHRRWTRPAIPTGYLDQWRRITWLWITMQRTDQQRTIDSTIILVFRMFSMRWIVDPSIKNRSFDRCFFLVLLLACRQLIVCLMFSFHFLFGTFTRRTTPWRIHWRMCIMLSWFTFSSKGGSFVYRSYFITCVFLLYRCSGRWSDSIRKTFRFPWAKNRRMHLLWP